MHPVHFQAEVRSIKELGVEPAAVSDAELKLEEQLIDHLAAKRFDPNEYHDEFKGRIDAAIQRKVRGKEISISEAPVTAAGGNVIDLMDALRMSLSARGAKSDPPKARKEPKRAGTKRLSPGRLPRGPPSTRRLAMLRRKMHCFTSLQNAQLTGTRRVRIPKNSSEKPS
jgi:DNA end-binding protein Ku